MIDAIELGLCGRMDFRRGLAARKLATGKLQLNVQRPAVIRYDLPALLNGRLALRVGVLAPIDGDLG